MNLPKTIKVYEDLNMHMQGQNAVDPKTFDCNLWNQTNAFTWTKIYPQKPYCVVLVNSRVPD